MTRDARRVFVATVLAALLALYAVVRPHLKTGAERHVIAFAIGVVALLIGLSLWLLTRQATRRLTRERDDLIATAKALAAGRYDARYAGAYAASSVLRDVAIALNETAESMEATLLTMRDKAARLDLIVNSMAAPLVVVDNERWVRFMNAAAGRVFARHITPDDGVFPLVYLTGSDQTEALAREAVQGEASRRGVALMTGTGRRLFDIVAVPVATGAIAPGVMLLFEDRTEEHTLQTMRSEFVANVTHELRSPLTSIRGFVETLRGVDPADTKTRSRFLDIIDIEAERLEQLISDILVLSEIESQRHERPSETVNVAALITEVVTLFADKAKEHDVTIKVEADPIEVQCVSNRLRQIVINLLDNALKYGAEHSEIVVRALKSGAFVVISVKNEGDGLAQEHQARVFERFYRVDKARSRTVGGTGLGLAIVKHIAQLYQGRAWVESSPGEGATFYVALKL